MGIGISQKDFERVLQIGRPPNVQGLFPNSKALLISSKFIDRVMRVRASSMAMAANGRNYFVIKGVLMAANAIGAAVIIEIARSEGGTNAYCGINFWNISRVVDAICNELGIMVPVAVHADHFGIKHLNQISQAKIEIPSLFNSGITSIAIDASHLPDDENLITNIQLAPFIPEWAGFETEIGEIKGTIGMSTPEEALFLISGLNARGIFPDFLASNNGSKHGIEKSALGIDVELTAEILLALESFLISGAQHGTSGNDSNRLRSIAATLTTKANVATALQMVSWGLKVDDFGNCFLENGLPVKMSDRGMPDLTWQEMLQYADEKEFSGNGLKKLNAPFENSLLALPEKYQNRMIEDVANFALPMMKNVFDVSDTAGEVIELILQADSYDAGHKVGRIENTEEWTDDKIKERVQSINQDKGRTVECDE